MSIDMYLEESDSQASQAKTMATQQLAAYTDLKTKLDDFVHNSPDQLKGKAYDSLRQLVSQAVLPLVSAGELLAEATDRLVSAFPQAYRDQVGPDSLKESDLLDQIADLDSQITDARTSIDEASRDTNLSKEDLDYIKSYQDMVVIYEDSKAVLEEKLQKLRDFNQSSPEIFAEVADLQTLVSQGQAAIAGAWDAETGTYKLPEDLEWTEVVAAYRFAKDYGVERPEGMSAEVYQAYIITLHSQAKHLQEVDGWDKPAVKAYLSHVQAEARKVSAPTAADYTTASQVIFAKTQEVGSSVYTAMYHAYTANGKYDKSKDGKKDTEALAKAKLQLVMEHLGAEVDEHNFLQLEGSHELSDSLDPMNSFWSYLREDVIKAYNTGKGKDFDGLSQDELGKKLHLFRSYISKQAITYIRQNYEGATDYDKLQAYLKENHIKADYTTGASLHNRVDGDYTYTQNMKVLLPKSNSAMKNDARMMEFIVDLETGEFVSEWNAYDKHYDPETGRYNGDPALYSDEDKYQIANTESFNYGLSKGQNGDLPKNDNDSHHHLDYNHPKDTAVRQEATKQYRAQKDVGDTNKDGSAGQYADIVKKEEDYDAWQKVPKHEKQKVYDAYIDWVSDFEYDNRQNPGISKYFAYKNLYGY